MHSNKRNKQRKKQKAPSSPKTLLRASFFALLITIPFSLMLLLIGAAILLKLNDATLATRIVGMGILYGSALFCGFAASRFHQRRSSFLCGVLAGVLLLTFVGVFAALMPSATPLHPLPITLLLYAALIPIAVFGANFAGKEKRRRSYKK